MSLPVRGIGDPLVGLLRAEKSLLEAGSRGEAVAEQLQDIRNAIRATIEQREAQEVQRRPLVRDYERER